MKHRSLFFALSLVILGIAPAGHAQLWFMGDSYGAFTYNLALPTGDTKDFADPISWRGAGLEFRKFINANSSVGLSLGWNVFYEKVDGTVEIGDGIGHATGVQDRTINAYPLMVGYQFYFGRKDGSRPYLGIQGAGYYVEKRLDIGLYSFENNGWNWGLAPELGILLPLERGANMLLNVRYQYAFETSGRGPYSYVGLNLGFAWANP